MKKIIIAIITLLTASALILAFAPLSGCHKPTHEEMLAQAPVLEEGRCGNPTVEAFNLTERKWPEGKPIKWYIDVYPEHIPRGEVNKTFIRVWNMWNAHLPIKIEHTSYRDQADILIRFEYLDGLDGRLGVAQYPPLGPEHGPVTLIMDNFDVKSQAEEGLAKYDFFTIALHEAGHVLGLSHSQDPESLMFPLYTKSFETPAANDAIAVRTHYQVEEAFRADDGRRYIYVRRNDHRQVSPNFKYSEFFSKCRDGLRDGHYLDTTLVESVQFLRDLYGPIRITSSFRNHICNIRAGGASRSQHLVGNALDFAFSDRRAHLVYQEDIKNKGCTFRSLWAYGVRGYGGYNNSNHIDTRTGTWQNAFAGGTYSTWGRVDVGGFELDPEGCGLSHDAGTIE